MSWWRSSRSRWPFTHGSGGSSSRASTGGRDERSAPLPRSSPASSSPPTSRSARGHPPAVGVRPMSTVGVDLAAQRGNTAAVVVQWDERGGRCTGDDVYEGLSDEDIVTLLHGYARARVGIDAPFGWPAIFVRTVEQWHEDGVWPEEIDLHQLRFRYTDRFVRDRVGWYPLSVSTDLISITAFRCARLLRQLAGDLEVSRVGGGVVEVYPAAALAVWGLPHRNYKGQKPPAPERRREILDRPSREGATGAHERGRRTVRRERSRPRRPGVRGDRQGHGPR